MIISNRDSYSLYYITTLLGIQEFGLIRLKELGIQEFGLYFIHIWDWQSVLWEPLVVGYNSLLEKKT